MTLRFKSQKKQGFTLTEVVLAIGVVGVLIVIFMAMFFPARKAVQAALTVREADSIVQTFTTELTRLNQTERAGENMKESSPGKYVSGFDKAYYWMLSTAKPGTAILVYKYNADLNAPVRRDGSFTPLPPEEVGVPGQTSMVVAAACLANNKDRVEDLKSAVGPVFLVKMTQLVERSKGKNQFKYQILDKPAYITNPVEPGKLINKPNNYVYTASGKVTPKTQPWGAEVMYCAEFYQLSGVSPERLKDMSWDQFKKFVFKRDLVFRR